MKLIIETIEELIDEIKEICEERFTPNGYFYVDKITRAGITSLNLHIVCDTPQLDDSYPIVDQEICSDEKTV